MRFDVILYSDLSADDMVRLGKLAEECGLGGVWIANNTDTRDAFVNFVPLAMQTSRLRMGPIAVSPFELHPIKIAQSLMTLNAIANGRAQIVVGAGGGTAENLGFKPTRIVRALRECFEMLDIALAYKRAGNQEKFGDAMVRVRTAHDSLTEQGLNNGTFFVHEAMYYTMAQQPETALQFLAAAVDSGKVYSVRIADDLPQLSELEGMTEYEAIQSRMIEHLNNERRKLGLEPVST